MQSPTVGVLLPSAVLRRALRGLPTYERIDLYAVAARELGVRVVLLAPRGVDPGRGRARGHAAGPRGWVPWEGPLPGAIHNRLLTPARRHRPLLAALGRRLGPRLFNPPVPRDKVYVYRLLAADPRLRPHLPATWPLTRARARAAPALARRHGALVAKPRLGGVGRGVVAIACRAGGGFAWLGPSGARRRLGVAGLRRRLRRLAARRRYLVQAAVPLAAYRGRRFDLRVPVQRDGSGAWTVPGAAVKRAWRHPF